MSEKNKDIFIFQEGDLESSFKLAIRNIVNFGDTDIFPFPYETRMFDDMEKKLIDSLIETHKNFKERLLDAPPLNINCCATLGYTGYRWATQIDPYWNAYFLRLVISIANKIEETRLSSENVYSYRFKPNSEKASLFGEQINWRAFQEDCLNYFSEKDSIDYVLVCDIADFYPRIYHHPLENALDRINPQKEISSKIKKLIQTFSGTNSYGLPVGCPASRILAELALDSIDHLLCLHQIAFKRYVDDFVIFCDSKEAAHSVLTFLSRKLMENEGLTLQKHKTNIMSKEEFIAITKAKLHGIDEDEDSPMKAKFMKLPIRYDPYSANAEEQYESIKNSLKDFDLLGMLSNELQKSKINQPFTKQLIRAFSVTDNDILSSSYQIICNSINELYPIFTTLIQVATSNWDRFDTEAKLNIKNAIKKLIETDSFILKTELNVAYIVRLIAKEDSMENQIILTELYKKNLDSILVVNIITQAMAKCNVHYWLSDLKRIFPTMNSAQRRLFIISSYLLGDEGEHWRTHNKDKFNFIENLYKEWGANRKQLNNLRDAL
jgi:hypothetical protein